MVTRAIARVPVARAANMFAGVARATAGASFDNMVVGPRLSCRSVASARTEGRLCSVDCERTLLRADACVVRSLNELRAAFGSAARRTTLDAHRAKNEVPIAAALRGDQHLSFFVHPLGFARAASVHSRALCACAF